MFSFPIQPDALGRLLENTAWPMTPPAPYSAFHILFSLLGISAAGILASVLAKCCQRPGGFAVSAGRHRTFSSSLHTPACLVIWLCGIILAASEVYKQLFIYYAVNQGRYYDWWYFPFQLCSTPMYLCLLFPLLPPGTAQKTVATYLKAFGFLGGIMALAEPSGLMHPYWTLTLHGLLWHILLIFIAFFCTASGLAGRSLRDFLSTVPLFYVFCLIATCINVATGGRADMFYISPYYPVTQIVFHQISLALGILPGIAVYLVSVCAGAVLCHGLLNLISDPVSSEGFSPDSSAKKETP